MPLPLVPSRIEKGSGESGNWISSGKIRSFVAVAMKTGKRQIDRYRLAEMFPGNNVIDFEGRLVVLLGNPAVFTTSSRAGPYQLCNVPIHASRGTPAGPQQLACFRFHNRKYGTDTVVVIEFRFFFYCQRSILVPRGEFMHAGAFFRRK